MQFNTPLQLGPASRTPPEAAQILTLPVKADDILILASDGLSDNLWDEDVLDEVVRFRRTFLAPSASTPTPTPTPTPTSSGAPASATAPAEASANGDAQQAAGRQAQGQQRGSATSLYGRRTLAGMLSEALCSRAKRVSQMRGVRPGSGHGHGHGHGHGKRTGEREKSEKSEKGVPVDEDEIPFARRAREEGRAFRGGKSDGACCFILG